MEIEEFRKVLGTDPKSDIELCTPFYVGVEAISVTLIDTMENPYKGMFTLATSTWGNLINKWHSVSPEYRYLVVQAVLSHKTLPIPLEHPSFCFGIEGCSRSAFDQIARARIGAGFASMGWRDNQHSDIGFRIPDTIANHQEFRVRYEQLCKDSKQLYHDIVLSGQSNWQDARAVLYISAEHRFSMTMNYAALQVFCGKRLKFCEQADTVAVAWLMRREVQARFPLLAAYLRPSCDWRGVCEYSQKNELSQAFGCLFASCGRNKDLSGGEYKIFNSACSDRLTMIEQLEMHIPDAREEMPVSEYDDLSSQDKRLFEEA